MLKQSQQKGKKNFDRPDILFFELVLKVMKKLAISQQITIDKQKLNIEQFCGKQNVLREQSLTEN